MGAKFQNTTPRAVFIRSEQHFVINNVVMRIKKLRILMTLRQKNNNKNGTCLICLIQDHMGL